MAGPSSNDGQSEGERGERSPKRARMDAVVGGGGPSSIGRQVGSGTAERQQMMMMAATQQQIAQMRGGSQQQGERMVQVSSRLFSLPCDSSKMLIGVSSFFDQPGQSPYAEEFDSRAVSQTKQG
jgi:hypothetical protein